MATRANPLGLSAEYQLPLRLLPDRPHGRQRRDRGLRLGSGEFFELYGPFNALPIEYEILPPAADGCWHFGKDDGSTYHVSVYVRGDAQMVIDHISFTVTFAP